MDVHGDLDLLRQVFDPPGMRREWFNYSLGKVEKISLVPSVKASQSSPHRVMVEYEYVGIETHTEQLHRHRMTQRSA